MIESCTIDYLASILSGALMGLIISAKLVLSLQNKLLKKIIFIILTSLVATAFAISNQKINPCESTKGIHETKSFK